MDNSELFVDYVNGKCDILPAISPCDCAYCDMNFLL
uniref:Uncharacterized protein n=1 Tax=Anguilla anguilla TaxID=7936 RepID=A0A0E9PG85_ANGAN